MKLKDIKIGGNFKETRKETFLTDNIIIEPLPAFCNSSYLSARDLDNGKEIFLKIENDVIVDIKKNESEVYDNESAKKTLDFILCNF